VKKIVATLPEKKRGESAGVGTISENNNNNAKSENKVLETVSRPDKIY